MQVPIKKKIINNKSNQTAIKPSSTMFYSPEPFNCVLYKSLNAEGFAAIMSDVIMLLTLAGQRKIIFAFVLTELCGHNRALLWEFRLPHDIVIKDTLFSV